MGLDHDAVRKAYPSITVLDDSWINYGLDASGNKVFLEQSKIDDARTTLNTGVKDALIPVVVFILISGNSVKFPALRTLTPDIFPNGSQVYDN